VVVELSVIVTAPAAKGKVRADNESKFGNSHQCGFARHHADYSLRMDELINKHSLLVVGPLTQELINAAWKNFLPMAGATLSHSKDWHLVHLTKWTVRSVRTVTGDPTHWRIKTPAMNNRFKAASHNISDPEGGIVLSVRAQTRGVSHVWICNFELQDFSALEKIRASLPLTETHTWYLFSGMGMTLAKTVPPEHQLIHSFGKGSVLQVVQSPTNTQVFKDQLDATLGWQI
jgi:hypothetical protein